MHAYMHSILIYILQFNIINENTMQLYIYDAYGRLLQDTGCMERYSPKRASAGPLRTQSSRKKKKKTSFNSR
jgi:hypothetical protein